MPEYGSFSQTFTGVCSINNGQPKCITQEEHMGFWATIVFLAILIHLIHYRLTN